MMTAKKFADAAGLAEVRVLKLALLGQIDCQRTQEGKVRFSKEELSRFLSKRLPAMSAHQISKLRERGIEVGVKREKPYEAKKGALILS